MGHSTVSGAKTSEPIEMPFWVKTLGGHYCSYRIIYLYSWGDESSSDSSLLIFLQPKAGLIQ